MSEPATALLSVQGEARVTVAPDSAALNGALRTPADSKAAALRAAAEAQQRLTADLGALGGVPLAAGSERQPLTWSAYSATTEIEYEHDPRTGHATPTGQVIATVSVSIIVRDFGVLDRLGDTLAGHDAFSVPTSPGRSTLTTLPGRTSARPQSMRPSPRHATTPPLSAASWCVSSTSRMPACSAARGCICKAVRRLPATEPTPAAAPRRRPWIRFRRSWWRQLTPDSSPPWLCCSSVAR